MEVKAQPLILEPGKTCTMVFKNLLLPLNNAAQVQEHLREYGDNIATPEGIKETEKGQFIPRIEVEIKDKGRFSFPAKQIEGYLLGLGVANAEVLIKRHPE